ncbi:hypothetical protein DM01DRAFT_1379204 [Hesseltinella vesiculosa]|uniref:Uncharacterized protein n=1 Tax=Hesseltinella vesiculosa TaxID=101127 RepID=A0A1X2GWR5_9FUNG|nr:hypothetical protein DM01DRAFT_1379204 [Hesseltinella vesiculosa]
MDDIFWRKCDDTNICHCDWRLQVYGCQESGVIRLMYIGNAVLSSIFGVLAFVLLTYRLKYCSQAIFEVRTSTGFIRPKPIEALLLFAGIFNILRALHAIILVTNALNNVAFRSFAYEFPWAFGYAALSCYVFGVAHTMCDNAKYNSWFHNPLRVDIVGSIYLVSPFISNNYVSISAGVFALHGDLSKATVYTEVLYYLWTFYCGSLSFIFLFAGWRLSQLLKGCLQNYKQDYHVYQKMKTGILKVRLATIVGSLCLFVFGLVVFIYALLRDKLYTKMSAHLLIAIAWTFDGIVATSLLEGILILNPRLAGVFGKLHFGRDSRDQQTSTFDDSQHTSLTPLTLAMAKNDRPGFSPFRAVQPSFYYVTPRRPSRNPSGSSDASGESSVRERTIEDDLQQYNAVTQEARAQQYGRPSNIHRRPSQTSLDPTPNLMTSFATYY